MLDQRLLMLKLNSIFLSYVPMLEFILRYAFDQMQSKNAI